MFGRFLDDSFAPAIRRDVTTATLSRLAANACYRYSAPFLATIADDSCERFQHDVVADGRRYGIGVPLCVVHG